MNRESLRQAMVDALRQAVAEIEAEYDVPWIIATLNELPKQIAEAQKQVYGCRRALNDADAEVQMIEAIIMAEISQELDARTGKAKFSNDVVRKAELQKRRLQNADWKKAAEAQRRAEDALNQALVTQTQAENRFTAAKIQGNLVAERLHLIGGML